MNLGTDCKSATFGYMVDLGNQVYRCAIISNSWSDWDLCINDLIRLDGLLVNKFVISFICYIFPASFDIFGWKLNLSSNCFLLVLCYCYLFLQTCKLSGCSSISLKRANSLPEYFMEYSQDKGRWSVMRVKRLSNK